MSRTRPVLVLALAATLLLSLLPGAATAQTDDQARILVFSKTAAFRHGSIPTGVAALQQLGADNGIAVDATEDASAFTDANLAQYNAVVWLSTTGDVLDDAQQAAFERYIFDGGGYVGIHSASDTEYDWEWYAGLVGAYFRNHPQQQNADIIVEDRVHPSTDHLPQTWTRFDEWYNFRANPRGNVHVLMSLDETSYNAGGGAMGDDHPISWCHAYEGGRSWYTGLGHTNASFSEAAFMDHVLGGIEWATGLEGGDCGGTDWEHYEKTLLKDDLRFPSAIDVADDGRVFFTESGERNNDVTPGTLWVMDGNDISVVDTLDVYTQQEDGLTGMELDPDFTQNGWIYLYYAPPEEAVYRLSRFTVTDDGLTDERQMLEIPVQRTNCCHTGSSVKFDPDGNLWLSTGDDTDPFQSQGYTPIDEREGREPFDAQRSSANTNDLRGKILRIRPTDAGGYTIPNGNLFAPGTPQTRPEIFAMGFRNPFRMEVDQETGTVVVADYGPDAGSPNPARGPEGRVTWQILQRGNYGWPYCHGDAAYVDYDFETGESGETFDCDNPVNESPNNTGLTDLPPVISPEIYYGRDSYEEGGANTPVIGQGGAPMAGPVYRYPEDGDPFRRWPESFDGQAFFYEWGRQANNLYTFILDDDQEELVKINRLLHNYPPLQPWERPHEMVFAPDGSMYIFEWDHTFGTSGLSRMYRIDYTGGGPNSCLDPDISRTIVIGGRDTGVPNVVMGAGCSATNMLDQDGDWTSAGRFLQRVNQVGRQLYEDGHISALDRATLIRAATASRIGRGRPVRG